MNTDDYIGPYRILRLINRGGQGSVYLGYDKRLQRRVAIKIHHLPPARKARRALLREARLVAAMHSPKIVPIHDVVESSAHLGLVMTYVPGCNLDEFLWAERPSLGSVLSVTRDLAGALAIARQHRVVHGDLKARNVLIAPNGRALLTDFGISRQLTAGRSPQSSSASLSALSPEQYLGQPADERSDLFALGALMYRMLSGRPPFLRDGRLDPQLLLGGPPPLREVTSGAVDLPPPLADLVDALLRRDPRDRPQNTRRVRRVLREVGRQLPAAERNTLQREARPHFRHESPEDLPPPVPADLARARRLPVQLAAGRWARLRQGFLTLGWPARGAFAAGSLALLVASLALALHLRGTPVRFEEPQARFTADVELPPQLSRRWILAELQGALREELGVLRVIGAVGAPPVTELHSVSATPGQPPLPRQTFGIDLHCSSDFCVLAVRRQGVDGNASRQAVLLPDMPLWQWRSTLHDTARSLFR